MKKLFLLLILFCFSFSFINCSKKNDTSGNDSKQTSENKTETKKEIVNTISSPYHIKYETKSDNESGNMKMWVKGKKFKINIDAVVNGKKNTADMYVPDKKAYMITDEAGEKMNMVMDVDEELENTINYEIASISERIKDFQKTGNEDVLGYKCDVYQSKFGDKFSIYKDNYVLKITDKNNKTTTATVFEPELKLEDNMFNPPEGLKWMTMEEMMK